MQRSTTGERKRRSRFLFGATMLAVFALGSAEAVRAATVGCQKAIVRAGKDFASTKLKALQKCNEAAIKGKYSGPCPDAKATGKIATAAAKARERINVACGGADRVCGTGADDDTPTALGWPAVCPSLEGMGCGVTLNDCGDIADCLLCINELAVDQAIALYHAPLDLESPIEGLPPTPVDATVAKCRLVIGRAASKFYVAKSAAIARCWTGRLDGKHTGACIPPSPGDGKYLLAIAKAEATKVAAICKACGGADKACGTADDLTPAGIGYQLPACPNVTVPGGASCGGPITNLHGIVDCVDCVSEFKVDCTTTAGVPQFAPYPVECNPDSTPSNPGPDVCEGWGVEHCEEAALDGNGFEFSNVVLPPGADEVTYEDVDEEGQVQALYPGCDTTLATWYGDDCYQRYLQCCPAAIGGYFPEPIEPPDLTTLGVTDTPEGAEAEIAADEGLVGGVYEKQATGLGNLPPVQPCDEPLCGQCSLIPNRACITNHDCTAVGAGVCLYSPCSTLNPTGVFGGRDIIYVHGLMPETIGDKITGVPQAQATWPADAAAFTSSGGYWWSKGRGHWSNHVSHFLVSRGAKNRYLRVAWASTQPMAVGVHAVLSQIVDAMMTGNNVEKLDAGDVRGTTGFCSGGCVVVSHSTGGPLADVALTIAGLTKTSPYFSAQFGNIGCIADRVKAHVAFNGAFGGSEYATPIVAATGILGPPLQTTATLALQVFHTLTGKTVTIPDLAGVLDSVLVDLVPPVMRFRWGPFMERTPVPVLTVAGAHDSYPNFALKWLMLHGFDDGVIAMDSACAKGAWPWFWPSGFIASPGILPAPVNPWLYDLGMGDSSRATRYFVEQNVGLRVPLRAAAGCTPFKTAWGLVQPVAFPLFGWLNPLARMPRHYSFIDTAGDHDADRLGIEYEGSAREETRTMTSLDPFIQQLVSPTIISRDRQEVRGKRITFKIFGHRFTWWIWKRTYDRLEGYQSKHGGDYVYDYILK